MPPICQISETLLPPGVRAVVIENDRLAATVLLDQGADIYALVYKPRGVDVLWKSANGLRAGERGVPPGEASTDAWLKSYSGGWQTIFPNGGGPNVHNGQQHSFHGEAAVTAWQHQIVNAGPEAAELRLSVNLAHSPFRVERTLRVEAGRPVLFLHEQVTNLSDAPQDYMWGQHPAYGAPFISPAVRLDTGAQTLWADESVGGPVNPLTSGERYPWPIPATAGAAAAVNTMPDQATPRGLMGYFMDFTSGWYALTNTELGFGVGLAWPRAVYPYAWFWQEMHASDGFPWNKQAYVMAVEPFTSIPGHGLAAVARKTGTQRTLAPGATAAVDVAVTFYESRLGVEHIAPDGTVRLKTA